MWDQERRFGFGGRGVCAQGSSVALRSACVHLSSAHSSATPPPFITGRGSPRTCRRPGPRRSAEMLQSCCSVLVRPHGECAPLGLALKMSWRNPGAQGSVADPSTEQCV